MKERQVDMVVSANAPKENLEVDAASRSVGDATRMRHVSSGS